MKAKLFLLLFGFSIIQGTSNLNVCFEIDEKSKSQSDTKSAIFYGTIKRCCPPFSGKNLWIEQICDSLVISAITFWDCGWINELELQQFDYLIDENLYYLHFNHTKEKKRKRQRTFFEKSNQDFEAISAIFYFAFQQQILNGPFQQQILNGDIRHIIFSGYGTGADLAMLFGLFVAEYCPFDLACPIQSSEILTWKSSLIPEKSYINQTHLNKINLFLKFGSLKFSDRLLGLPNSIEGTSLFIEPSGDANTSVRKDMYGKCNNVLETFHEKLNLPLKVFYEKIMELDPANPIIAIITAIITAIIGAIIQAIFQNR